MEDYPNNETLIQVLNAIDETKADKANVAFIGEKDSEDIVVVETASPYTDTIHRFTVEVNCAPLLMEHLLGFHYLNYKFLTHRAIIL